MTQSSQSPDQLFIQLSSRKSGLTESEAMERIREHGENRLEEHQRKSVLSVFFSQFADLLVIILIVAAVLSLATGNPDSTIVIFLVIILNAVLGTAQFIKAEQSLEGLRELSAPQATVLRDGKPHIIPAKMLVPGDIMLLEAGNRVPADGRILNCHSLQTNESALTGEAESVEKTHDLLARDTVALADQKNMVFSGSFVTYGRADVIVTATGMQTQIGGIAALMNQTHRRKTPLQVSLDKFSRRLSLLVMLISVLVFGVSWYRGMPAFDAMMFAVALAVAAIPEALSSIVTISLAIGTSKMAKQGAIIKDLQAVESLGCVSVICSDKTGTLTQNKMTVTDLYCNTDTPPGHLILAMVLCNDSYDSEGVLTGDPTETALIAYCWEKGKDTETLKTDYPRTGELPFDSDRKLMSTVHIIDGHSLMFTKGAPDVLIPRLTHLYDQNGRRPIESRDIDLLTATNRSYSSRGLRVLAFAEKEQQTLPPTTGSESGYTFLGLAAMADPPRKESQQAVRDCISAGIRPVMITGDHVTTASAIAEQIGILQEGQRAITGNELDAMTDEQLSALLPELSVYARVTPAHKIRIVRLWQTRGEIVAMTGDGVNDAPALKRADIGVAMGITGTEVSKEAASMVLTDDNFATIIQAVENGRNVYRNITNAIRFLLSGNTAGILAVLACSLFALPIPFTAVHLLFINLLTDSLPALALSMEPSRHDLLLHPPRNSTESILNRKFLAGVLLQGMLIAAATLAAYFIGLRSSPAAASTMAFAVLCLGRLWHGFNARGNRSIFRLGLFSNWYSIGAFLLGASFLAMTLLVPPLRSFFDTVSLHSNQLLAILGLSLAPTILIQVLRLLRENTKKKKSGQSYGSRCL